MKTSQEKQNAIKQIYEKELSEKITSNYVPFFMRYGKEYEIGKGVLFVGKAENMADKDKKNVNEKIEGAFEKTHSDYINAINQKNPFPRSQFVRILHKIAKKVSEKYGVSHFARTNLYKLATTKTYLFSSEYEKVYEDIFRKEIELLQPKYVILLTSGIENNFLKFLGKQETCEKVEFKYKNKGNEQTKNIRCVKIENYNSIFITALHPQGKPEGELVEKIIELIDKMEQ